MTKLSHRFDAAVVNLIVMISVVAAVAVAVRGTAVRGILLPRPPAPAERHNGYVINQSHEGMYIIHL